MNSILPKLESPFISTTEKYLELTEYLQSSKTNKTISELENLLSCEGRELMRRLLEEHLKMRGPGDIWKSIIGSDGIKRSYKQLRPRRLITVFGKIIIKRMGYSHPGKSSLFPLDAVLNLPVDIYSHGLRKAIAFEVSRNSFSEAVDSIKRSTGVNVHKRQAEMLSQKAAQDFDEYYEQMCSSIQLDDAKNLPLLVLTTDSKGIVVRKQDLKEATRKQSECSQNKLNKRLSKGEKKNRKRMASVASVYQIEKWVRTPESVSGEFENKGTSLKRPRPKAKRVWASLEKSSEQIINELFEEAYRRDPEKQKQWVCLVDGDPNQLERIKKTIKNLAVHVVIILDIIHVIEYLWKAARIFHEEANKASEKWVSKRLLEILRGKASRVAGGMRRAATLLKIETSVRKPVDTCANYLLKYSPYLRYNEYLEQGMPIATGVIEGACRHLVKDRMDITGARWSLNGAEAILKLRSLRASGDFDDYWKFHEHQEFYRNHLSQYFNPSILEELSKEPIENNST